MLLVATVSEIRALKIVRVENDIQISECGQKIQTDGLVTKITQFKKNNRIFYGGKQVNITELKLSDNIYDRLKEFFTQGTKKLKKEQHMDSVFSKMIPEFFKFGDKKEVHDIKIDEQRNVLFCLSYSVDRYECETGVIDIIDLGTLGDSFKKITTIY